MRLCKVLEIGKHRIDEDFVSRAWLQRFRRELNIAIWSGESISADRVNNSVDDCFKRPANKQPRIGCRIGDACLREAAARFRKHIGDRCAHSCSPSCASWLA